MGLFGRLRGIFGGDEPELEPDPEDLYDLPNAAMTVEQRVGLAATGEAALCFQAADAGGFEDTLADLEAVLEATEEEVGTSASWHEDGHGFRWLVLEDESLEDLATGLVFAAESFEEASYGDNLLAALVAFADPEAVAASSGPGAAGPAGALDLAYLVYAFERGRFYPFVPEGGDDRDAATEFRLQSVLRDEIPFESDRSQWFPLWPDREGDHPWE